MKFITHNIQKLSPHRIIKNKILIRILMRLLIRFCLLELSILKNKMIKICQKYNWIFRKSIRNKIKKGILVFKKTWKRDWKNFNLKNNKS